MTGRWFEMRWTAGKAKIGRSACGMYCTLRTVKECFSEISRCRCWCQCQCRCRCRCRCRRVVDAEVSAAAFRPIDNQIGTRLPRPLLESEFYRVSLDSPGEHAKVLLYSIVILYLLLAFDPDAPRSSRFPPTRWLLGQPSLLPPSACVLTRQSALGASYSAVLTRGQPCFLLLLVDRALTDGQRTLP